MCLIMKTCGNNGELWPIVRLAKGGGGRGLNLEVTKKLERINKRLNQLLVPIVSSNLSFISPYSFKFFETC